MSDPLYPYKLGTIEKLLADMQHPADLAEVAKALAEAVQRCHDAAPGARLQCLTHGALASLEDAEVALDLAGDMWAEAEERYRRDEHAERRMRDAMQGEMA